MCGRYTLTETSEILARFGVKERMDKIDPNYNVAPGQFMPIVVREDNDNITKLAKWGVIPFWARDKKPPMILINSQAEKVATSTTWKKMFLNRRCLIPASGFYEWRKKGSTKEPHYFFLKKRELFAFAGMYDIYKSDEGYETYTYTIITTEPNGHVQPLHNRMPVILDKKEEDKWLNPDAKPDDLLELLDPLEDNKMETHEVVAEVGSPKNNYPELIYPL